MEIKKILDSEGLAALLGGSGYMELIRELREIANYFISESLYTDLSNFHLVQYLRWEPALSGREACKIFCR